MTSDALALSEATLRHVATFGPDAWGALSGEEACLVVTELARLRAQVASLTGDCVLATLKLADAVRLLDKYRDELTELRAMKLRADNLVTINEPTTSRVARIIRGEKD